MSLLDPITHALAAVLAADPRRPHRPRRARRLGRHLGARHRRPRRPRPPRAAAPRRPRRAPGARGGPCPAPPAGHRRALSRTHRRREPARPHGRTARRVRRARGQPARLPAGAGAAARSGSRSTTSSPTWPPASRSARWGRDSCRRSAPPRSSASPSPATATSAPAASTSPSWPGWPDGGRAVVRHPALRRRTATPSSTGCRRRWSPPSGSCRSCRPAGCWSLAGVVPVALLVYWVCSSAWTLGQSAVVARWFPTPGHGGGRPARQRREDQVADLAAGVDDAVRLDDLAERQGAVDDRPELARRDPFEPPGEVLRVLRGDARAHVAARQDGVGQPGRHEDQDAVGRQQPRPERRSRLPTVSSTTSYLSASSATRCRAWSTTSSAPSERTRSALRSLHTPVTWAPARSGELDGGAPDGARGAVDQHPLPGTDQVAQEVPGGAAAEEDRGGLLVARRPRAWRTSRSARTAASSACAPMRAPVIPQTSSPDGDPGHARAHRLDHAGVGDSQDRAAGDRGGRGRAGPARRSRVGSRHPRMRASPEFRVVARTRTSDLTLPGHRVGQVAHRARPRAARTAPRLLPSCHLPRCLTPVSLSSEHE